MKKIKLFLALLFIASSAIGQSWDFNTDLQGWVGNSQTGVSSANGKASLILNLNSKMVTFIKNVPTGVNPQNFSHINVEVNNPSDILSVIEIQFTFAGGNTAKVSSTYAPNASANVTIDIASELGADWTGATGDLAQIRFRFQDANKNELSAGTTMEVDGVVFDNGEGLGLENLQSFNFSFYPNPAKEVIQFNANHPTENVQVYDITGNLVLDQKDLLDQSIDVSSFANGMYFCKVSINNTTGSFKFIKQ